MLFPFRNLDDDEFVFLNSYADLVNVNISNIQRKLENVTFSLYPNDVNNNKYSDYFKDIDPDQHVFKGLQYDSKYVTEDDLNSCKMESNGLSVIHFNSRSLRKNFDSIVSFVNNCKKKV